MRVSCGVLWDRKFSKSLDENYCSRNGSEHWFTLLHIHCSNSSLSLMETNHLWFWNLWKEPFELSIWNSHHQLKQARNQCRQTRSWLPKIFKTILKSPIGLSVVHLFNHFPATRKFQLVATLNWRIKFRQPSEFAACGGPCLNILSISISFQRVENHSISRNFKQQILISSCGNTSPTLWCEQH